MVIWIASYSRSGNTFFRLVLAHMYEINTSAAFQAGEVLLFAGVESLVGYRKLPDSLREAIGSGDKDALRRELDALHAAPEMYFIKTHAGAHELFGTNYDAVLVVRDGRDAVASLANYMVDIP